MSIAIYRFFTDYGPLKEKKIITDPKTGQDREVKVRVPGKTAAVHKIVYGPLGSDKVRTVAFVEHLRPAVNRELADRGSAAEMAWKKWDIIEPAYQKWLAGQEITPDGTPLAAWSGVGPEQAEALRARGIHTVEQLAQLTDSHVEKYGIAGMRHLRDSAKLFVSTLDKSTVENALAEKDVQIAGLQDTIESMREMMKQMQHSMANLQMAQQTASVQTHPEKTVADGDDAFGGTDDADGVVLVPVTTPRRSVRRR